jgi:hypothetical protein
VVQGSPRDGVWCSFPKDVREAEAQSESPKAAKGRCRFYRLSKWQGAGTRGEPCKSRADQIAHAHTAVALLAATSSH